MNKAEFYLAKNISIADYENWVKDRDSKSISELVSSRLIGRYLRPYIFKNVVFEKDYKNGFSVMANCCLCIEALQSFKLGLNETPKGTGSKTFEDFFKNSLYLKNFAGKKFYKTVRCGILHQGETTGGWKIVRKGELLNNKTINARKFLDLLISEVTHYSDELAKSDWESAIAKSCRKKFAFIIKNCVN